MEKFIVNGGKKLLGKTEISSAKNACLPLISASVLCKNVVLKKPPEIADVAVMADIFKSLGGKCDFFCGELRLDAETINKFEPNEERSKSVRASLFFLGSLLARFKNAVVYKPGGCDIGSRPIDIHIAGLSALGVTCREEKDKYVFCGENMRAGTVFLRYPSVGATVNIIEAAVLLKGETVIKNAAKEPEILCLCEFLNANGFNVRGGGTSEIIIDGSSENRCKKQVVFKPIKDRIEAGTFMCACAACGGKVAMETERLGVMQTVNFLRRAGGEIYENRLSEKISEFVVEFKKMPRCASVKADVFPSFATDLQPLAVSALLKAKGESVVIDDVYKKRFGYVGELKKFGANAVVSEGKVRVVGVESLCGADVCAGDLRGGAALVVAALSANGRSEVRGAEKIRRGYENFDEKLRSLGADVEHVF